MLGRHVRQVNPDPKHGRADSAFHLSTGRHHVRQCFVDTPVCGVCYRRLLFQKDHPLPYLTCSDLPPPRLQRLEGTALHLAQPASVAMPRAAL
ncbi:hypothetical protein NDU88_004348 [Pleurodeles waltl]|uniref:Uncharacterized protein n=1 Tax=Pleurodeles waltl TaxID=8319 RepID=A0AAV7V100_PLEWA|nr:hypothetical protein NDU88_004348 [Pleurodeles waltl]